MTTPGNSDVQGGWGARLVSAREAAGLTQPTLANRLGVSLRTVVRWEAVGRDVSDLGRRPNSIDQRRIADELGVPVSDLFPRTDREAELEGIADEYDDLLERVGGGCS
jgi:transcriptional regulator with XRE-family HTH domain